MTDQKLSSGLTRNEITEKVDHLIFGLDQLEKKYQRRITDETGKYREQYRTLLLRPAARLLRLEQNHTLFELRPVLVAHAQKQKQDSQKQADIYPS